MPEEKPLCIYIVVKETLSPPMVALTCFHAGTAVWLNFGHLPEMVDWREKSFKKRVTVCNDGEWKNILAIAARENMPHQIMVESRLGNQEVSVVFAARKVWPKSFGFLRLYK